MSIITSRNKKGILVSFWCNVKHFELLKILSFGVSLTNNALIVSNNTDKAIRRREIMMQRRRKDCLHFLLKNTYTLYQSTKIVQVFLVSINSITFSGEMSLRSHTLNGTRPLRHNHRVEWMNWALLILRMTTVWFRERDYFSYL